MKKIVLFVLTFTLFTVSSEAGLNELIEQNVKNAEKSYEQTIEEQSTSVRLWIHIRKEAQRKIGEDIQKAISEISIGGGNIERKPLQLVDYGPSECQLRYFKNGDSTIARELLSELNKLIPNIKLNNFSTEYSHVRWIKNGHFELWLSPDIEEIVQPKEVSKLQLSFSKLDVKNDGTRGDTKWFFKILINGEPTKTTKDYLLNEKKKNEIDKDSVLLDVVNGDSVTIEVQAVRAKGNNQGMLAVGNPKNILIDLAKKQSGNLEFPISVNGFPDKGEFIVNLSYDYK